MLDTNQISNRIVNRIKDLGMKQKDICEKAGIAKSAMSNYMNGNRIPDTETILKLSKILEVSIEWILTGESTNVNNIELSENEIDLLCCFNKLSEREQIKWIGKIEQAATDLKELEKTKSLPSKTG